MQTKAGVGPTILALVVILAPLAEHRFGSRLTFGLFLFGDWLSTLSTLLGAQVLAALGSSSAAAFLQARDCGSSAGAAALAGAVAASSRGSRRVLLLAVLFGSLLALVLGYRRAMDVQHLLAATPARGWEPGSSAPAGSTGRPTGGLPQRR